jgi:signal transduction histidine kinase
MARPEILIVDDEPANLTLLKTFLREGDYEVATFRHPLDAIAHAQESPPDLVLLDLQMPEMDGLEVCRRLRASPATRLAAIIIVTALGSNEHRLAALEVGADDFISKPVDRIEVIARVKSLLRLKAVMDQLADASVAKNEFVANMSHEMRQPLNSIVGFTEILLGKPDALKDEQRLRRYLENIHTSGEHLMGLISGVLDLAAIEARRMDLNVNEVDLVELLASVGQMMQPIADSYGVVLQVEPSEQLNLRADPMRLRQIVLNLANNAVKFTPSGGQVTIGARPVGEGIEISVADNGIGIEADDLARVFEIFTQADSIRDRESGGSGLGLALVKQLTELHGGRVELESEPGRGTTVRVRLPA